MHLTTRTRAKLHVTKKLRANSSLSSSSYHVCPFTVLVRTHTWHNARFMWCEKLRSCQHIWQVCKVYIEQEMGRKKHDFSIREYKELKNVSFMGVSGMSRVKIKEVRNKIVFVCDPFRDLWLWIFRPRKATLKVGDYCLNFSVCLSYSFIFLREKSAQAAKQEWSF